MPELHSFKVKFKKCSAYYPKCFILLSCRTDARTVSSGSSAWEGQFTSMVLSEYASTEMSIHALYMHEVTVCGDEYMASTCARFIFPKFPQRIIQSCNFSPLTAAQATIPWRTFPAHVAQAGERREQRQRPRRSEEWAPRSLQKFPPLAHFPNHGSQPQRHSYFRLRQCLYRPQQGGGFLTL